MGCAGRHHGKLQADLQVLWLLQGTRAANSSTNLATHSRTNLTVDSSTNLAANGTTDLTANGATDLAANSTADLAAKSAHAEERLQGTRAAHADCAAHAEEHEVCLSHALRLQV